MAHFQKDPFITPFGIDEFLRSTRNVKVSSASLAFRSVPFRTIDGYAQQVLRKGTVLAKITSGPDTGKVGPFQGAGTAEVSRFTATGTVTGGTFTITALGVTTAPIAWNATAAAVAAAVNAALLAGNVNSWAVGTGGPLPGAAVDLTWGDAEGDVAQPTVNTTALTGTTPGITVSTVTPGVAGSTDGRGVLANIVGINNTFLPALALRGRDVEVGVVYEAAVVQANCFDFNAAGVEIPLSNTTAAAMFGTKTLDIRFR